MLIDCSYFTQGPRRIHNVTLGDSPDPAVREARQTVQGLIEYYTPLFLDEMFGICQAGCIMRYLGEREAPGKDMNPEMESLLRMLREPCADYVFWHILRDGSTMATTLGLVEPNTADKHVSPLLRQVAVWNNMVERNRRLDEWLSAHCKLGLRVRNQMLSKGNRFNL